MEARVVEHGLWLLYKLASTLAEEMVALVDFAAVLLRRHVVLATTMTAGLWFLARLARQLKHVDRLIPHVDIARRALVDHSEDLKVVQPAVELLRGLSSSTGHERPLAACSLALVTACTLHHADGKVTEDSFCFLWNLSAVPSGQRRNTAFAHLAFGALTGHVGNSVVCTSCPWLPVQHR